MLVTGDFYMVAIVNKISFIIHTLWPLTKWHIKNYDIGWSVLKSGYQVDVKQRPSTYNGNIWHITSGIWYGWKGGWSWILLECHSTNSYSFSIQKVVFKDYCFVWPSSPPWEDFGGKQHFHCNFVKIANCSILCCKYCFSASFYDHLFDGRQWSCTIWPSKISFFFVLLQLNIFDNYWSSSKTLVLLHQAGFVKFSQLKVWYFLVANFRFLRTWRN